MVQNHQANKMWQPKIIPTCCLPVSPAFGAFFFAQCHLSTCKSSSIPQPVAELTPSTWNQISFLDRNSNQSFIILLNPKKSQISGWTRLVKSTPPGGRCSTSKVPPVVLPSHGFWRPARRPPRARRARPAPLPARDLACSCWDAWKVWLMEMKKMRES